MQIIIHHNFVAACASSPIQVDHTLTPISQPRQARILHYLAAMQHTTHATPISSMSFDLNSVNIIEVLYISPVLIRNGGIDYVA